MGVRSSIRSTAVVFCVALFCGLLSAAPAAASVNDGNVVISNNEGFTPENGVRSGKGTKQDPYVIEGWDISRLEIHDTSKYVVIRNNIINSLTLNWIGRGVKVVNN